MAKRIIYMRVCVCVYSSFLDFLPIQGTQCIDQSSLCCTVCSHQLSVLYIVLIVCIHQSLQQPGHVSNLNIHQHWMDREEVVHICSGTVLLFSCQVVFNCFASLTCKSHGLQLSKLLCPWDFPGKNTGVGCPFFLQGIFPTQRSNPSLLHCRWSPTSQADSLLLSHYDSAIKRRKIWLFAETWMDIETVIQSE